ncbi:MAG: response regulator transcription factor [Chloroflexi bacterium]|nr:response regulator transcription factor [Chloroflexota bacterium]
MTKTVLVVDDDPTIRDVLELYLKRDGFSVLTAAEGQTALHSARANKPDLIVLDLMLPQVDGWEVCRRVRAESNVPILMVTARGEEYERILGLGLGADDYVIKPFSPGEVIARVKAIFRRIEMARATTPLSADVIRSGDLVIEPGARRVTLRDQPMALTAKEFDLLHFLASYPRQVFTREQLLDQVWGYTYAGETSTVTVHVRHLREKLEADPANPRLIETVWGVGYRFNDQA